jgi:hypothetical protein
MLKIGHSQKRKKWEDSLYADKADRGAIGNPSGLFPLPALV